MISTVSIGQRSVLSHSVFKYKKGDPISMLNKINAYEDVVSSNTVLERYQLPDSLLLEDTRDELAYARYKKAYTATIHELHEEFRDMNIELIIPAAHYLSMPELYIELATAVAENRSLLRTHLPAGTLITTPWFDLDLSDLNDLQRAMQRKGVVYVGLLFSVIFEISKFSYTNFFKSHRHISRHASSPNKQMNVVLSIDNLFKDTQGFIQKYAELEGYILFADDYFNGQMGTAFQTLSALMKTGDKGLKAMKWPGQVFGDTEKLRAIQQAMETGEMQKTYSGLDGYMKFADEFFNGQMGSAYKALSALIKAGNKGHAVMKWPGAITCHTEKLRAIQQAMEAGEMQKAYSGMDGYMKFADEFFTGQMGSAYQALSALMKMGDEGLKVLAWPGQIACDTATVRGLQNKMGTGELQKSYSGLGGYMRFADDHFNGKMATAYQVLSALMKVGDEGLKVMNWPGQILCDTITLSQLQKAMEDGTLVKVYSGVEGYSRFAKDHFDGQMKEAYKTLSALMKTGDEGLKVMNWPGMIMCSATKLEELQKAMVAGEIQKTYGGLDGYMLFADDHFNGQMQAAYQTLSALMKTGEEGLKVMNWAGCIICDTAKTKELQKAMVSGEIQKAYGGLDGYMRFADDYFNGQMQSAYKTLSALMKPGDEGLKVMNWPGQIYGDTDKMRALQKAIEDGELQKMYGGLDGYMSFANDYFNGQMGSAYQTLSALMKTGDEGLKVMDWPGYITCDTTKLKELQKAMVAGEIQKTYGGLDGYMLFADDHFNGQMQAAYQTLSALMKTGDEGLNVMNWPGCIMCDTDTLGVFLLKGMGISEILSMLRNKIASHT